MCCAGLPGYIGRRAGTTTLYAGVNYIPQVRDYEFGYRYIPEKSILPLFIVGPFLLEGFRILYNYRKIAADAATVRIDQKFMFLLMPNIFSHIKNPDL